MFEYYGSLLNRDQIDQLIVDLKREDKLYEFLSLFLKSAGSEVGSELVKIANDVYENYLLKQDHDLSQSDFIEYSENVSKELLKKLDNTLLFLNFKITLENGLKS